MRKFYLDKDEVCFQLWNIPPDDLIFALQQINKDWEYFMEESNA